MYFRKICIKKFKTMTSHQLRPKDV